MLAGEPPFTGPSSQAVIARHAAEPAPLPASRAARVPLDSGAGRRTGVGQGARRPLPDCRRVCQVARLARGEPPVASAPAAAYGPEATSAAPLKPTRHRRVPAALATLGARHPPRVGVLFAWLRTRPEPGPAGPSGWRCSPSRTSADSSRRLLRRWRHRRGARQARRPPRLPVIARTSPPSTGHPKSPRQVARELAWTTCYR